MVVALLLFTARAAAQVQPPSDKLLITAASAYTWTDGKSDIIQLEGPVTIQLDRMELTANGAVIWLTPEPGLVIDQQKAEIALIGDAVAKEAVRGITRTGSRLLINVSVRGDIRISAEQRLALDRSDTALYQRAADLRLATNPPVAPSAPISPNPAPATPGQEPQPTYIPTTQPTGRAERAAVPMRIHFNQAFPVATEDNTIAQELSGDVILIQERPNRDILELRADRAVLFFNRKAGPGAAQTPMGDPTSAYLEGDVRIDFTSADKTKPEQQLFAQRVYYDFVKDQAVMTDAVMRTTDPTTQLPITIRAEKLRQLAQGEFEGEHVELSTSSFATPSYSVRTDEVYIHQEQEPQPQAFGFSGGNATIPQTETETEFTAQNDYLDFYGLPAFYFPSISGSVDNDPFPLRSIDFLKTKRLGDSLTTEWGLYESLGIPRPHGLDVSFLADFFGKRGPATGLDSTYTGSNIDQDSKEVTDYSGLVRSFVIFDRGIDTLGGDRTDVVPPDQYRGKFLFEHQQTLPDNWQVQLRYGYSSDPTFLEEYYPDEFYDNQPYNAQAYVKHQQDTEALTFLADADTNRFPSTSDQQQEQFDVEKLPEAGYQRIGDSLAGDTLTFYSSNSVDRLRFDKSHYSLDQEGYVGISPGLPSEGYTGTITSPVGRGDTRQEIDYPIQLGQIKVVPYVMGRDTGYTDSPGDDAKNRVYGAAGVRITTDFWKVDDLADSDLFDLHRVRHIIEPEINLYTSGETVNRDQLYIYDENVDGIADVSALEAALHQRWETYRGAPGRQVSVDFLSLNVSADIFTNPPKDAGLLPDKFRGLFFPSDPEASIPRDAINADATWLVSNSTALLSDAEYNVDHEVLATASIGLAVKRYDRLNYYLGLRYIEQLNSDIATFATQYQLTSKYFVEFTQSYDFGQNSDVSSEIALRRQFDRLSATLSVFHDSTTGDSGVLFRVSPEGFGSDTGVSPLAGKTSNNNNPH
jgi:hypothetical protein